MSEQPIHVKRAPVLALGATEAAERLGYLPDTAIILGRDVTTHRGQEHRLAGQGYGGQRASGGGRSVVLCWYILCVCRCPRCTRGLRVLTEGGSQ
jgi:hypothetical protein